MTLTKLTLFNFRNISELTIHPNPNLNFITGFNGSGKTSILESIYILSVGKSFKGSKSRLNPMINAQASEMTLVGEIKPSEADLYATAPQYHLPISPLVESHELAVQVNSKSGSNQYFLDQVKQPSVVNLTKLLPVLVISPDIMSILLEGPEERRALINWGMFFNFNEFNVMWRKFKELSNLRTQIIQAGKSKQRLNQALDSGFYEHLRVVTKALADISNQLNHYYQEYCSLLIKEIKEVLRVFLPELEFEISYYQGWPEGEDLYSLLLEKLNQELQSGRQYYGLHRFDLQIKCYGQLVQYVLSRGQLKLLACALKIAQGDLLKKTKNHKSIYLIDDLAAELDETKQLLFVQKLLEEDCQVFMTYINNQSLEVFKEVANSWTEFVIEKGEIKKTIRDGELQSVKQGQQLTKDDLDKLLNQAGFFLSNELLQENQLPQNQVAEKDSLEVKEDGSPKPEDDRELTAIDEEAKTSITKTAKAEYAKSEKAKAKTVKAEKAKSEKAKPEAVKSETPKATDYKIVESVELIGKVFLEIEPPPESASKSQSKLTPPLKNETSLSGETLTTSEETPLTTEAKPDVVKENLGMDEQLLEQLSNISLIYSSNSVKDKAEQVNFVEKFSKAVDELVEEALKKEG